MLTKPQVFYDDTHKQALGYQNLFYLKKAQWIKPTLYDGSVISSQHVASPVIDDEETLILEEVSRSKMLAKQNDSMSKEKKVNTTPTNYVELNRLSKDFGKLFVPQQELSDEQAFWLQTSHPNTDQSASSSVKIEAPKELPKVNLVNTSLKKLKYHLSQFDTVVKNRITFDAITEGEWGFEHTKAIFLKEIIPFLKTLKDIFNVFHRDLLNEDSLGNNQNALEITEYFENNDLKAHLQAKDTTICKLKEHIKTMRENDKEEKVKHEMDEIETINIELEHRLKCSTSTCRSQPTGNRSLLMNFVSKFLRTIRFENDQVAKITGYGDYQMRNVIISRVYYVEGLGHNLFSVGQFCDADLEVAFRKNTCFIQNLEGVDLLSGSRDTNLYTISLDDMLKTSLICLLSKASKTKSWLWHRRLSHLNFGTLNKLAKDGLARGIPKLKFQKDHLCSACALGKSKKSSHQPKAEDTNQEKLYLLHMDLCGPMRVESINGKKTENGTEFFNQTLRDFYENSGISHQTFIAYTPQQNGVAERRNRTLMEAARTMLIFSKAPLFLWAEEINTTCYTQNRSLIRLCYNKTPYELMHNKKPDLSFLHVFGSLCYPTNDDEDLGKLNAKADIGIFAGYAPAKKAFRIYNRRT
ncbi:retrovirus-related pol polyprotein from transposon TNT 1-94 [Tanacetum coccineum]